MRILKYLKTAIKVKSPFEIDVDLQNSFIQKLKAPENDYERSYNQYKCQAYLNNPIKIFILNVISFFILPLALLYFLLQSKNNFLSKNKIIFISGGIDGILPEELINEFGEIKKVKFGKSFLLLKRDIIFIYKIFIKYPFQFYFVLKTAFKIAIYRYYINKFSPSVIVVSSEYSFTSSILTAFCEQNQIKHFNVMHGEKLYYIRDSYFRYHRFYIWDSFYIKLFIKLKAEPSQFNVSVPRSFYLKIIHYDHENKFDFTYYLGGESENECAKIFAVLNKLKIKGKKICIRPHPRYSDNNVVSKIFREFEIEDPFSVAIGDSILRTDNIVSLYSTVLFQAYLNDKNIIIDDVSNVNKYLKLYELDFIMLNKHGRLLSNVVL